MSGSEPRYLSAAEAAKALGVTTRALRLYEQKGLVRPLRSGAGWRAYGPEALARLHQVLALKRMGISLAEVGALLKGRLGRIEEVLALQEEVLAERQAETERALRLVRRARARIGAGDALSVDDLTTLTRETTMNDKLDPEEMRAIFEPLIQKHYDAETLEALRQRPYDQAAATKAWEQVTADWKAAMEKGDPTTAEAMDVARRWSELIEQFTGGDPKIFAMLQATWKDAYADPALASRLRYGEDWQAFMQKANAARLKAGV